MRGITGADMKPIAAGFLIRSINKLYLLGHVTQPDSYVFNPKDRLWTIPKGVINEGERLIDCALRETKEETGIDLPSIFNPFDYSIQPKYTITTKHKVNYIFEFWDTYGTLLDKSIKCESLIENKRFPYMNGKPEIDMFIWVNKEQASQLIQDSLKGLFE